jgi:AraC-like DNA-binding protein
MRMDSARYLLTHQRQSVKQTAAALGFENPLYFSKQFRKSAGVSPRAYRRTDPHL